MPALTYDQYINSPEWARRRVEYFAHHNRLCRLCGKGKDIHLHHLTYERMGAELDRDLMALCKRCHSAVHAFARCHPKLTLEAATFAAIRVRTSSRPVSRSSTKATGKINGKPVPGLDPEYARRRDAREQQKRELASR